MPDIRVSIALPYALGISNGEYHTAHGGEPILVTASPLEEMHPKTIISAAFYHEVMADLQLKQQARSRDATSSCGVPIACCVGIVRYVSAPTSAN